MPDRAMSVQTYANDHEEENGEMANPSKLDQFGDSILNRINEIRESSRDDLVEVTRLVKSIEADTSIIKRDILGLQNSVATIQKDLTGDPAGYLRDRVRDMEKEVRDIKAKESTSSNNRVLMWVGIVSGVIALIGTIVSTIIVLAYGKGP